MSAGVSAQIGTVLRAPKAAELIAGHLRRQIVRGELLPGRTLPPENKLMEQYGVSRPTLREALRILEAEALISVRLGSHGGAQVIAPDVSVAARYVGLLLQIQGTTVNDVYEARMITEPPCARLFALHATDEDIAHLTDVVAKLKIEVDARNPFVPDPDTWARLTYRFHEIILQGSGIKTMAIQGAVLQDIIATHLRAKFSEGYDSEPSERFQRVISSYMKLIELAKAHNADGAQKHWLAHMEAAAHFLLKDDLWTKRVVDLFS